MLVQEDDEKPNETGLRPRARASWRRPAATGSDPGAPSLDAGWSFFTPQLRVLLKQERFRRSRPGRQPTASARIAIFDPPPPAERKERHRKRDPRLPRSGQRSAGCPGRIPAGSSRTSASQPGRWPSSRLAPSAPARKSRATSEAYESVERGSSETEPHAAPRPSPITVRSPHRSVAHPPGVERRDRTEVRSREQNADLGQAQPVARTQRRGQHGGTEEARGIGRLRECPGGENDPAVAHSRLGVLGLDAAARAQQNS